MVRELQRHDDIPCLGDIRLGDRLDGDGDMTSSDGAAGSLPPVLSPHVWDTVSSTSFYFTTHALTATDILEHTQALPLLSCFVVLLSSPLIHDLRTVLSSPARNTVSASHFYASIFHPVSTAVSLPLCPYD